MPIPLMAIGMGASALGSIFGHHGPGINEGDINSAYRAGAGQFNFNPNANDPALQLMQSRANNLYRNNRYNGVNEVQRAGLGGSSIGMNNLQGIDENYARQMGDITNQNLGDQRQEQLGLFNSNQNYMRQLQMAKLGALNSYHQGNDAARTGAIGSLAGVAGRAFGGPKVAGTQGLDFSPWNPTGPNY